MSRLKQAINLMAFAAGRVRPLCGPVKAVWDVTHKCNLKCKHCHLWQITEHEDLTTEEGKKLISDLGRIGTLHLSFSGGEPFLRKDIYELLSHARDVGLTTAANTNGTILASVENARRACEAGLGTAFISLDGPDAETHNALRGSPKAFELALRAIDNLVEQRNGRNPMVFINTTVTRDNVADLEKILTLAREHGVDGMTMSIIQDIDKYSPEAEFEIEAEQADGLSEQLISLAEKSDGLIPHSPEYLQHFQTFLEKPKSLYRYRCTAGYAMACILPNGDVNPCPVPYINMGNIRDKSFPEIWFSKEADAIRRQVKAGKHPICWFDCIAPINVLLDNMRRFRIRSIFHKKTLQHILRKVSR